MTETEAPPAKVPQDTSKDVYYSRRFVEETVEAFEEIDTNKNGFLSLDEVKKAYKKNYPKTKDADLVKLFAILDYDKDKKVSLAEYIDFDMEFDAQIKNYEHAILV